MSKTIVVGGNGYIGTHLKKLIPNFIYVGRHEFDLLDKNQIVSFLKDINIDRCIILSSVISYEEKIDFCKEPFLTNLTGLNNLLSVLSDINKNIKIIYFSSMTVYSENNILPVVENSRLEPLHSYGLSKVYAESLVNYYDFSSIIIRIPGIYGGDRKNGLIYNSIQKLKRNEDIFIDTSSLGYWEAMHIDDMLSMFIDLLNKYSYNNRFEIFNIAYGEKIDIIETLEFLKKQIKSNSKICIEKKYKDLYLSNKKILKIVDSPISYKKRLKKYLGELL